MYIDYGTPYIGHKLDKLKIFLKKLELDYDNSIEFTVNLMDDEDEIIATGSIDGNVLKCIAISDLHQGENLSSTIITELRKYAFLKGRKHLMLFTKPKNKIMFSNLGFYPIGETKHSLLMENIKDGIDKFIDSFGSLQTDGTIGAIVANCNPFTLGHRYLIESASRICDFLHVFVLSEDKSMFSSDDRFMLVKQGTSDLNNIAIHKTGPYMISSATFPTYFIKDKTKTEDIRCELDIEIFAEHFAKKLNITKRFIGTEPFCMTTNKYNQELKLLLPPKGIEVIEIERKVSGEIPISASKVREEYINGNFEMLATLVPETTLNFLKTTRR